MRRIISLFLLCFLFFMGCDAPERETAVVPVPTVAEMTDSVQVELNPAADLPDSPADIMGGFLSQEGDRILVGSGFVDISPDGEGGYQTKHDGPKVEVQINDQTRFWADVTHAEAGGASGTVKADQVVEALSQPVNIPYPAFISVWGQQQDDLFVASAVLFDVPGD